MTQRLGGQALVEGVMVLSPQRVAMCVRGPHKKIIKRTEARMSLSKTWGKILFLRGIVNLLEMMVTGTKALMWSSNQQLDKNEQVGGWGIFLSILFSLVLALGLFVALPLWLTSVVVENGFFFQLVDGVLRVAVFLLYLLIISRFNDIKRVFQYHGAEHMAIHCYESGKKMATKNVRLFPPEHQRCGTAFLFLVLVVSVFVFSVIMSEVWIIQFLMRLALVPVVASIAYELLKLAAHFEGSFFSQVIIAPGIWFQKITTKKPDNAQIEVAIAAVKEATQS